jgi:hypothetical protein
MSSELLAALKSLQHERAEVSPFASHLAFVQWADQVAPRLSFDQNLSNSFAYRVRLAKSKHNGPYSNLDQVNEAIGILNQAVSALELKPPPATTVPTTVPATNRSAGLRLRAWWKTWGWLTTATTAVLSLIGAALKLF